MEKKERLYINVVKGTAIFLMLWGHSIEYCANGNFAVYENPVFKWIYTFHMPLFMMVSGYLFFFSFRKRELKPLLIHRTQGLLHPIFFAGVFNRFLMLLFYKALGLEVSFLNGSLVPDLFSFWFLWSVLTCSLAVGIAFKVTDNIVYQGALLLAGAGGILLFTYADLHLFMYPFFLGGFLFAKYRAFLPRWVGKLRYLALIVFPLMVPFYEVKHYIYITPIYSRQIGITASFLLNVFRISIGFAGSIFILTILWEIVRFFSEKGLISKLVRGVSKLGENSLQMYCISMSVLSGYLPEMYPRLVNRFGFDIAAGETPLFNFVFTPLLALGYSILIYGMILILKKTKVHACIFGR